MGNYILKRLGMMLLTMFCIMTIGFCVLHSMPGGPYDGDTSLDDEQYAILNAKLNLDKPILVQSYIPCRA